MESFHENNNSSVYCVKLSLIQQVYTTYYLNTNTILRNISVSRNLTREFNKNVLEKLKQNLFVYNCLDNRTNKMRKRKEITYPQKWQLLRKFPHLLVIVIAQIWFPYLHQNFWFYTQSVAEFLHKNRKSPSSCIYEIQPFLTLWFLFTKMCLFWSAMRALFCWDPWAGSYTAYAKEV